MRNEQPFADPGGLEFARTDGPVRTASADAEDSRRLANRVRLPFHLYCVACTHAVKYSLVVLYFTIESSLSNFMIKPRQRQSSPFRAQALQGDDRIVAMCRDMDLVRQILLVMKEHEHGNAPSIQIDGYTAEQIGFHVWLMMDAGLIEGEEATTLGDPSPSALPIRIKWAGYEFLAAAMDNTTWRKVMRTVQSKAGGITFDVLKAALLAEAKGKLGL